MRNILLNHFSKVLVRTKDIRIIMPDQICKDTKVVLLLHGYCGDHNDWVNLGNAIRMAEKYKMVFVMPSAENSYYLNINYGDQFYTYIAKEVVDVVTKTFKLPNNWYIAGLSMGGYGALLIGLKEKRFKYIGAFSAPIDMKDRIINNPHHNFDVLFKNGIIKDIDILEIIKKSIKKPIYLYCGEKDQFYVDNINFAKQLTDLGYIYVLKSDKRGHEWSLWTDALADYLEVISKL